MAVYNQKEKGRLKEQSLMCMKFLNIAINTRIIQSISSLAW
jgi:hypothetical protein